MGTGNVALAARDATDELLKAVTTTGAHVFVDRHRGFSIPLGSYKSTTEAIPYRGHTALKQGRWGPARRAPNLRVSTEPGHTRRLEPPDRMPRVPALNGRLQCTALAARLGHLGALSMAVRNRGQRDLRLTADLDRHQAFGTDDLELCRRADMPWIAVSYTYLGLAHF